MKPDPQAILADFAARLGGVIMPDLKTPFLMGSTGLMAAVIGMIAEDLDSAAARRVEENRAIRALFNRALALNPPPVLAATLEPLAIGDDEDLRLSALVAANQRLRAALITLQTWAENQPGAEALNDAIWAELSASTDRRRLSGAPF